MASRFSEFPRECFRTILPSVVVLTVLLSAGCASEVRAKRFNELLQLYPRTEQSLKVRQLPDAPPATAVSSSKVVTIMVHPAYALFFRDERRNTYTEAKYDLLEYQLFEEVRFIRETAKSGGLLILVIPGGYEKDSIAPSSYTSYLNGMAHDGSMVYYIRSETSHSGEISSDTAVKLHDFLRRIHADKILVGGGFIGRCQAEFYRQLSTYVENIPSFIVPEISTLSPDDMSSDDAFEILSSIRKKDYRPVLKFIDRKSKRNANTFTLSPGLIR